MFGAAKSAWIVDEPVTPLFRGVLGRHVFCGPYVTSVDIS